MYINKKSAAWLPVLLAGALILTACGANATPTVDPQVAAQTVAAIQTQAVVTAMAQLTNEAALNPSPTSTQVPTNTQEPTYTAVPATATATAVPPTAAPTLAPYTPTNTPAPYQCSIEGVSPSAGTQYASEADFDATWTLLNTGLNTWDQDSIDVVYVKGDKIYKNATIYDLPKTVKVGEKVSVIVDMRAPKDSGTYTTTWGLNKGGTTFCTFSIEIKVK